VPQINLVLPPTPPLVFLIPISCISVFFEMFSAIFSEMFSVSPQKEEALRREMRTLGIRERDLDETFVQASGPGGQNVNKVSTCVVLVYRSTGLLVKCQKTRSQSLNRFHARRILLERVASGLEKAKSKATQERERVRRQKRRRSRRAKEKLLQDKHHRSEKKAGRSPVQLD